MQFGWLTMPLCQLSVFAFTSGMTSGTSGSMRNALESSITSAPRSRASGAYCREASPEADRNTMSSSPANDAGEVSSIVIVEPRKSTVEPAERFVASSRRRPTGTLALVEDPEELAADDSGAADYGDRVGLHGWHGSARPRTDPRSGARNW